MCMSHTSKSSSFVVEPECFRENCFAYWGEPIEVDYKTISKNLIAGPRFQVFVDALKQPINSINLWLHNGNTFEQKVIYNFYPLFCSTCKCVGHSAVNFRVNTISNQGAVNSIRDGMKMVDDAGWQVQRKSWISGSPSS